ncbi:MAG: phosphotransferase [Acidobacteria bacterium]|nr:phosphotransferase [Acidobacteriota bacterium]
MENQPNYPPGPWTPLEAHASGRAYFRGEWEAEPALLADFGEDQDGRDRFVAVTSLFHGHAIPVPRIFQAPPGVPWLVEEFVEGRLCSSGRWSAPLEDQVLDLACRISEIPAERWPESAPPLLSLDVARLRFELGFFEMHFLEGLLNAPPPPEVHAALCELAASVAEAPMRLAHRDYHSENLLVKSGSGLIVLDYQDALLAPRCYDLASLAVDGYRSVPGAFQARCASLCAQRFGATSEEFERCALQRALKALGTFGYQITRRKRSRYLASVRLTLGHALKYLKSAPIPLDSLEPFLTQAREVF